MFDKIPLKLVLASYIGANGLQVGNPLSFFFRAHARKPNFSPQSPKKGITWRTQPKNTSAVYLRVFFWCTDISIINQEYLKKF